MATDPIGFLTSSLNGGVVQVWHRMINLGDGHRWSRCMNGGPDRYLTDVPEQVTCGACKAAIPPGLTCLNALRVLAADRNLQTEEQVLLRVLRLAAAPPEGQADDWQNAVFRAATLLTHPLQGVTNA